MKTMRRRLFATVFLCALLMGTSTAVANPYDLELSNLLDFEEEQLPDDLDDDRLWGYATGDDTAFDDLTRDLGQVFAPRPTAPSETLGQAGFAIQAMTSFSLIPNEQPYWGRTMNDTPGASLFSSHFQVRKGLPFSFEVVGNLSHLARSQMFVMGADVRWALHEGYDYFPDIGVRGSANTVTGAPQLNMINASWDISASKSFGIAGVAQITPYAGYQQLYTVASTRVLNAVPQDPRPPRTRTFSYEDGDTGQDREYEAQFAPEYVFGNRVHRADRFFGGLRFKTWIMSFTAEAIVGGTVQQITLAGGIDF